MKILLLQSRPEKAVSDDEFQALCRFGGVKETEVERLDMHESQPQVNLKQYDAVLMGGGPANFAYTDQHKSAEQLAFEPWLWGVFDELLASDIPFFGACLGLGALVTYAGGSMSFAAGEAVGAVEIRLSDEGAADPVLKNVPASFQAFVGHKEGAQQVPPRLTVLAQSDTCIQMVRLGSHLYGTQFHPELDPAGLALRIDAYKHAGYFAPEEAVSLIAAGWASDVGETATLVLKNFVHYVRNRADKRDREH